MEIAAAETTLGQLGFSRLNGINGLLSIAHLFGITRSRCGIYVLSFSDGLFYIGQAVDVVRRFAQHRLVHGSICGFSFRAVDKTNLDREEQRSIAVAERAGIPLTNRVHVSQVSGETDLAELLSVAQQEDWLEGKQVEVPGGVVFDSEHPQRLRFRHQFQRLSQTPLYLDIRHILIAYTQNCIPVPGVTQFSFWSVSALPATNRGSWPRLAAININGMETLVVGHYYNDPDRIWGFINVTASVLKECFGDRAALTRMLADCSCNDRHYRTAGPDSTQVCCEGVAALTAALGHLGVIRAAKTLVLRLMRKGPTIFSKFHAPDLADVIIPTFLQ